MRRTLRIVSLSLLAAACSSFDVTSDGGSATDSGTSPDSGSTTPDSGTPTDAGATTSTASNGCDYSYSAYNSSASIKATSTVQWSCTATKRSMTSNDIPDHDVGTFPNSNCPNTISAQSVSASMTLNPVNTGSATNLGIGGVGYAMNGVKFDPGTAGTCTDSGGTTSCTLIGNSGSWNIEALGQSSFNFGVDSNNAHVQPTGAYHYHGMPEGVLTKLNKGMTPTLVGYALDGFPVYARYGYSSPMDSSSAVKVIKGSYQVKATADSGRPSTSTYPMGAFSQDYEYMAGSGDLDECNGRTDVTPEFPAGIYHYYITDTYPYIQRCAKGAVQSSGMGPGDGGMMMPPMGDGGMMPPMDDGGMLCGSCTSTEVCCPSGAPCAGQCVPDCRMAGPGCPSGTTCDSSSGICKR